jgi:ElaB/YqjD/DUF883 family membrane-anchored ribosome-binding protein
MLKSQSIKNINQSYSEFLAELQEKIAAHEHVDLKELAAGVAAQLEKSSLGHTLKSAVSKVNKSVHSKPWFYVGGAAVISAVLGMLIRNR